MLHITTPDCIVQCVQKVTVHLGYLRVQLKCDGTRWRTGGEVRKVAVNLWKVLEVTSTSVYAQVWTGFILFANTFCRCRCLSAQGLSERTVDVFMKSCIVCLVRNLLWEAFVLFCFLVCLFVFCFCFSVFLFWKCWFILSNFAARLVLSQ